MTVGSLFAGIGGFDLGFTRAGFTVSWQVEIDEWCRGILARHFPNAQRHGDIRGVGAHNLEPIDVICGGFPCQPFSSAGKRGGAEDDRYLWPEMCRVIRELQPAWVVAENVNGLVVGEMAPVFEQVLSDLEDAGYDVQPFVIPACAVDAPHRRDRVWIVAHSRHAGILERRELVGTDANRLISGGMGPDDVSSWSDEKADPLAHPNDAGPQGRDGSIVRERGAKRAAWAGGASIPDTQGERPGEARRRVGRPEERVAGFGWAEQRAWEPESGVGRLAHGVPERVARLKALGNAVVPQIPELIARMILEVETMRAA